MRVGNVTYELCQLCLHVPHACSMLIKTSEQIPRHILLRRAANRVLRVRHYYEISARRNLNPGHPMFRTRRDLELVAKAFDTRLTAVQRTLSRFWGPKLPNALTIQVDQARSLRAISGALTGILDVLRYQVCSSTLRARLALA